MKYMDFADAQGLAMKRAAAEVNLKALNKGVRDVICNTSGSCYAHMDDPKALDFVRYALENYFKEQIAGFDRALAALGIEP